MKKAASVIASLAFILLLLITSIELLVYGDSSYFLKEYQKYGINQTVNMSMEDLLFVTDEMMDYLKDDREDLDIITTVGGETREFFSQREKDHMEDVKVLFLQAIFLRRFAFFIVIAVFIYAIYKKWLPLFCKCFLYTAFSLLTVTVAVAALVSTNFNRYFTIFHELFFSNDLWILDPSVDLLINIVPLPFFIDTALRCTLLFGVALAILCALAFAVLKGNKKTGA